jgi:hypothetical protein
MAKGADMSAHPKHSDRHPYPEADKIKLRKGITEGVLEKYQFKVAQRT